jgi:integrase
MNERDRLGIESEWLFPVRDNPAEHIGTSTVNSWAETFTRISGKDFYAHSIRHYFTTSLARAGIPDGVIQSIVAWESSDMVRLYTDIDADEQIGMYFSNGEISVPDKKGFADM